MDYPCETLEQLLQKEAYFIRLMKPLCNIMFARPLKPTLRVTCTKQKRESLLVSAKDLTTEDFTALHRRFVQKEKLDADALAAHNKQLYKNAWGIDIVDQAW